ncbi:tumor necrosis factor receptor superfamily member 14 isoform 2-T4 [Leptodactylus fuscus]|uniref:tumor necrosis factor receptor superfamily member 14 isoform X2 n=1 Tax=Leptodactylus fuscus TaxID=238119 RepID=UPI003F4E8C2D
MGGHFRKALHLVFTLVHLTLACLPREYESNNLCCPMCDKGSFVKAHCTPQIGSSVCVLCAENTYTDQPNGLTECFRCKECDLGAGLIVKEKCTTISNTVCECKAGHFCLSPDCDLCQEHTQCHPGQYVKKNGTWKTDTVCENCSPGHYSDKDNSLHCLPWTKNLLLFFKTEIWRTRGQ